MHKIGGAAISPAIVLSCANVAARVIELTTFLKEEEEKADKEAVQRRRALLRGRAFADISLTVDEASTKRSVETVDLGAMTDFSVLHAPIALRGDPTKEEVTQQVTSMAELLESLETAADLAKEELVLAATGLAMTDAARSEFRRLAGSEKVQNLIHGGEKEQPRSFHCATKQLVADNDSDSDEEGGIIQSEFGTSLQMEKSARAKPSKKETNGEAVQSSDEDEDEDMDLSAAIKRKFK